MGKALANMEQHREKAHTSDHSSTSGAISNKMVISEVHLLGMWLYVLAANRWVNNSSPVAVLWAAGRSSAQAKTPTWAK